MAEPFLNKFLATLTRMGRHPDKMIINQLTLLAGDVHRGTVAGVTAADLVGAIESRLLRAGVEEKLPILYLMDSIMFNHRGSSYSNLFSNNLASVFMDAYRSSNEVQQGKLKKLITMWEERRIPTITVKALGQLKKKLDPSLDLERFIEFQTKRFPPPRQAMQLPQHPAAVAPPVPVQNTHPTYTPAVQVQPPLHPPQGGQPVHQQQSAAPLQLHHAQTAPPYANATSQHPHPSGLVPQAAGPGVAAAAPGAPAVSNPLVATGGASTSGVGTNPGTGSHPTTPPVASSGTPPYASGPVSQQQFERMLVERASSLLSEMQAQMGVPEQERIEMDELSTRDPDLFQQVFTQARDEMRAEGIEAPPASQASLFGAQEINWNSDYLKDKSGVAPIVNALYHNSVPGAPFPDEGSGLAFPRADLLEKFQAERMELGSSLVALQPSDDSKLISRAWWNPVSEWVKGSPQVMFVAGSGFSDDAEEEDLEDPAEALRRQENSLAESFSRSLVEVDEDFTTCALTGQEFERVYDDDSGQWMFKGAVRPEKGGPIYLASAYHDDQLRKRKLSEGNENLESVKHQRVA